MTFWADHELIHLSISGARIKSVRSHLSSNDLAALAAAGGRPAGPPPQPSTSPVTVQRRASNSGTIMVTGQVLALGRTHAHTIVTVHVAEHTITIDLAAGDHRTFRRITTQPVRSWKAQKPHTLCFLARTSSIRWDQTPGGRVAGRRRRRATFGVEAQCRTPVSPVPKIAPWLSIGRLVDRQHEPDAATA